MQVIFILTCIIKSMEIQKNIALSNYSTMKLGGYASSLVEINNATELIEALNFSKQNNLQTLTVGQGSNIIWRDEGFNGLLIVNKIKGFDIISEDDSSTYITIGAGEIWDVVVGRCVKMGLSGIECLSLIPGTAGATPVQNVGAYGQDISQTLITIQAYDRQKDTMVTLTGSDCNFGYRSSIFNTTNKNRFIICSITLMLNKSNPLPPFYNSLSSYLETHNIKDYSPSTLREAVIAIRNSKLPDPKLIPNCGSFFQNPIIDASSLSDLKETYPTIPSWTDNNQNKLSAAWLIEQSGFANYYDQETGIATYEYQPLVLINRSAKSTSDLIKFANKIKNAIKERFNIELNMEPLLLPEINDRSVKENLRQNPLLH